MSTVCRGLLAPLAAAVAASAHIAWSQRHRALACDFQPKNAVEFPTSIEHERHGRYELVATGVRKVTFLSIRVYNVGLYVATKDVPKIVARLSALALEDRQALQASLADPERGAAVMEDIAKEVGIMIRIVPVRDTDVAHMRDGFMRGVAARTPEADLGGLKEFFPNPRMKFPKGAVMQLFSQPGVRQTMALEIDGHDYGTFDGSGEVIRAVVATYCSGKKVASEELRQNFVEQLAAQV